MRRVPIQFVKEDDVLGENIYNSMGQIMMKEGYLLKDKAINSIKKLGINSIIIVDKYSNSNIKESFMDKPRLLELIMFYKKLSIDILRYESNQKPTFGISNILVKMENLLIEIIDDIKNCDNVFNNLLDSEENIYTHSVNVMLLSLVFAYKSNINYNDLKKLALGALVHDVGEIISEENHEKIGFELIRKYTDLPAVTKIIILEHKKGGQNYLSNIVQACDLFIKNLETTGNMNECFEFILAYGGGILNNCICNSFIKIINPYPIDTKVRLSDGSEGIIDNVNKNLFMRPIIRLYYKDEKEIDGVSVNLMENPNLIINKILYKFSFEA